MSDVKNYYIENLENKINIHSQYYITIGSLSTSEGLYAQPFLYNHTCAKNKNNIVACLSNSNKKVPGIDKT